MPRLDSPRARAEGGGEREKTAAGVVPRDVLDNIGDDSCRGARHTLHPTEREGGRERKKTAAGVVPRRRVKALGGHGNAGDVPEDSGIVDRIWGDGMGAVGHES